MQKNHQNFNKDLLEKCYNFQLKLKINISKTIFKSILYYLILNNINYKH